jgi:serine/threonine protein kinase
MSPEIVTRKPYNGEKADVWALGVVLYVTLSGKFPFIGEYERVI